MIKNWFSWENDNRYPKIHPTQKPIPVLKRLIQIFTDKEDVVIDPCAGSGSTLRAAAELGRSAYGFEIKKDMYKLATEKMLSSFELLLI
jgi:site-specific DNA-methyltransferase (adenine-specific)